MYEERIIIHVQTDNPEVDVGTINILANPDVMTKSPIAAVQAAVDDYKKTPDGAAFLAAHGDVITWADVLNLANREEIPTVLTLRHGFTFGHDIADEYTVDADEDATTTF